MKRLFCIIFLMIGFFLLLFNSTSAQHFINLTDKAKIEMGLNLIRKGIQEKDTTMVLDACFLKQLLCLWDS